MKKSIQKKKRKGVKSTLKIIGCFLLLLAIIVDYVYSKNGLSLSYYNIITGKLDGYSCAVTPPVRQTGNRLSGPAETAHASLLA